MPESRAQKRLLAVLLADAAGSTAIAETLGSERSKFLFDEVNRLVAAAVERYGGTVAQLLGDGVLALFGAPTSHEDDAERAVLAALDAERAVSAYASDVEEAYGIRLGLRIAVEMGAVVVGAAANSDSERWNALGDPVNVAARLKDVIEPGEVVAGPEAARAVGQRFALESLGQVELRGRSQPVEAFRVCGEATTVPRARSALVGRDFEQTLLRRAVEDLADGLGVVLAVTGEPGIGKTRLLTEAVAAAGDRVALLEGHCASYASGFPLWPVRDLIRTWLRVPVTAAGAQLRLELRARLAALYPDPADRFDLLARVLGLAGPPAGERGLMGELSHENVQQRIAETVADLAVTLSDRRPLLLVIDDLHWADPATLALVERLLDVTEQASVGIAMVYRSERDSGAWALAERARQRFPHRFREIELRGLPADAASRLAGEVAGGELPEPIASLVVERAGGNPFFVEEAVCDLVDRGVLDASGGLAEGIDMASVVVPGAIRTALQARLDRLPKDGREVVSVASVAGRRFGGDLLARVLPGPVVRSGLIELLRAELVVERRRRPEPEYTFRHGLVQEVAYAGLLESDRRALHLRVADALEAIAAASGDVAPAPLLARHLAEAAVPDRAAAALIAAGDQARAIWATGEAVAHYRRAREFLAQLGDDGRSRETLFKIALVHHLDFDFARAETAYDEAFCCRRAEVATAEPTETLRTATAPPAPPEIVPGYVGSFESASLTDLFYRGLLSIDADLNVLPDLAENFRVSSDGTSYLFQLREHLRWSDGEPLTAHDFEYGWRRMREEHAPGSFQLDDVSQVVVHDSHTLELVLERPRNYFPYILTLPVARPWPRHACERDGAEWRNGELVTCGPYMLESMDSRGIVAVADPGWRGRRGNAARIEIDFLGGDQLEDHGLGRWRDGEFGVLAAGFRTPADPGPDTESVMVPSLGVMMLALRPSRPALASPDVRRAIAAAIDTERLAQAAGAAARAAQPSGVLPPAMPGHSARSGTRHDPAAAAKLLERAGFPGGRGLPPIRLLFPGWHEPVAALVAAQLERAGLRIEPEPAASVHEALSTGDADMVILNWVADHPDPDGFFRGLVDSVGGRMIERDPEVDRLLAEARELRDHDRRLGLYQQVDRHCAQQQATLLPLLYVRTTLLRRPWVTGVWSNPMTLIRLADAVVEAPSARAVEGAAGGVALDVG
jgi:ABC-type transport system substrate-binding protein/class 3 adenylate cyclase